MNQTDPVENFLERTWNRVIDGVRTWFADYTHWLLTDKMGRDDDETIGAFVAQTGATFPIGYDQSGSYDALVAGAPGISPYPLDVIIDKAGKVAFLSNNAGGVLGGISTGQDVIVRFAVKPTSSILQARRTVTVDGKDTEIVTKGRHDPCVGIRGAPVAEAMLACVLADQKLRHAGQMAH